MQASNAALTILLCILTFCVQVLPAESYGRDTPSSYERMNTPSDCCFSYTSRPIKEHLVVSYVETSSQCSKPGIIFQTIRGQLVCANPMEAWVQKLLALKQSVHESEGVGVPK
ncbi:C-C motif chemokine 3-like 1 [Suncus etruscus]|uniref:C-C motif chemokine 3-like 1 n=1 Tax=Suncus etruscus TaxID=109475 RepID=UPI00210F8344|nr:C-C motif chemokine 3-like 1 [Suncus etruscus]